MFQTSWNGLQDPDRIFSRRALSMTTVEPCRKSKNYEHKCITQDADKEEKSGWNIDIKNVFPFGVRHRITHLYGGISY